MPPKPPLSIPRFLLPRGPPRTQSLALLPQRTLSTTSRLCASSSSSSSDKEKGRTLAQPDKFRPPSHPARRVVQTRNGKLAAAGPTNYPGPRLSEKEKEEKRTKQYPNMFPPEGTVSYMFLTSRWIHIWIAMSVLTCLATFTFTTNFKASSPYAHLLPPWSDLLYHPIGTISQALSVYRMHVQHNSLETKEKRQRRVEDAEKRRQYRIAHGLEEDPDAKKKEDEVVDDQSPVADASSGSGAGGEEYVDFEGKRRPVKKWLGIW